MSIFINDFLVKAMFHFSFLSQSVAERNENIIENLTEQLKNKEQAIQVG